MIVFGKSWPPPETFGPSLGMGRMASAGTVVRPQTLNSTPPAACSSTPLETSSLQTLPTAASGRWSPPQELFRQSLVAAPFLEASVEMAAQLPAQHSTVPAAYSSMDLEISLLLIFGTIACGKWLRPRELFRLLLEADPMASLRAPQSATVTLGRATAARPPTLTSASLQRIRGQFWEHLYSRVQLLSHPRSGCRHGQYSDCCSGSG